MASERCVYCGGKHDTHRCALAAADSIIRPDSEHTGREYTGPANVTHLPPGMSGDQLRAFRGEPPKPPVQRRTVPCGVAGKPVAHGYTPSGDALQRARSRARVGRHGAETIAKQDRRKSRGS